MEGFNKLQQSTIKIEGNATGTGFFVAPGLILTCAHNVEKLANKDSSLQAHWNNKKYQIKLLKLYPGPYPDLALLEADFHTEPFEYLDDSIKLGDKLYFYGYTDEYPEGDSGTVEYEGTTGRSARLLKLKMGQIRPGLSGAPIMNLRTGKICGMIKATRDRHSDLGGRAIPTSIIFEYLRETLAQRLESATIISTNENSNKPLHVSKRIRNRREELQLSYLDLKQKIIDQGHNISVQTLQRMEKSKNHHSRYRLPVRKMKGKSSIEIVAEALDLPIGYLLGGFSHFEIMRSFFRSAIENKKITIIDRVNKCINSSSFKDFFKSIPSDEHSILQLPLFSFRNEKAFAIIFHLEKIYSGCEMLTVNEPPLIFWDDEDVMTWTRNMELSTKDALHFAEIFNNYREYFRELARQGHKVYKVVLNFNTFIKFLRRKSCDRQKTLLRDLITFLDYSCFNLIFLEPDKGTLIAREIPECIVEFEIISRYKKIPDSMEGTLAVAIQQTPPYHKPVEYFLSPISLHKVIIQKEKARIEEAWARALDQYEQKYLKIISSKKMLDNSLQRQISIYLLERISREICLI
jgi:hypothetical protein